MIVQKCPVSRFVTPQPLRADLLPQSVKNCNPYKRPRPPGQEPDRHRQIHCQLCDLRVDVQHVQAYGKIKHPGDKLHENRHRIQVIGPDQDSGQDIPPAIIQEAGIAFEKSFAPAPRRRLDFLIQSQRPGVGGIIVVRFLIGILNDDHQQHDHRKNQHQNPGAVCKRSRYSRKKCGRVLFGQKRIAEGFEIDSELRRIEGQHLHRVVRNFPHRRRNQPL